MSEFTDDGGDAEVKFEASGVTTPRRNTRTPLIFLTTALVLHGSEW
jgi:hypothetical protein